MISVLIPAFDEAESLKSLLPAVPTGLMGLETRAVVICDGSTDGTCRVASELGAEVIKIKPNHGKGHALRIAADWLANREFDAAVVMDGDGQHDPADLGSMVEPVLNGSADITVGTRYFDGNRGSAPLNRYLVRTAFTRYLDSRLAQPVTDPFSGYRCMSARAFRTIDMLGNRYEGELEVRFEAEIKGLRLIEVPIPKIYLGGQSKMTVSGNPIVSRLRVIRSYLSTTRRKSAELAASTKRVSVASPT